MKTFEIRSQLTTNPRDWSDIQPTSVTLDSDALLMACLRGFAMANADIREFRIGTLRESGRYIDVKNLIEDESAKIEAERRKMIDEIGTARAEHLAKANEDIRRHQARNDDRVRAVDAFYAEFEKRYPGMYAVVKNDIENVVKLVRSYIPEHQRAFLQLEDGERHDNFGELKFNAKECYIVRTDKADTVYVTYDDRNGGAYKMYIKYASRRYADVKTVHNKIQAKVDAVAEKKKLQRSKLSANEWLFEVYLPKRFEGRKYGAFHITQNNDDGYTTQSARLARQQWKERPSCTVSFENKFSVKFAALEIDGKMRAYVVLMDTSSLDKDAVIDALFNVKIEAQEGGSI